MGNKKERQRHSLRGIKNYERWRKGIRKDTAEGKGDELKRRVRSSRRIKKKEGKQQEKEKRNLNLLNL